MGSLTATAAGLINRGSARPCRFSTVLTQPTRKSTADASSGVCAAPASITEIRRQIEPSIYRMCHNTADVLLHRPTDQLQCRQTSLTVDLGGMIIPVV